MFTICSIALMGIETIGQAYDAGWGVRVRCAWGPRDGMKRVRECVYGGELDLNTLVWTRGRDFPLGMLESRLKCPRCGSRESSSGLYGADSSYARGCSIGAELFDDSSTFNDAASNHGRIFSDKERSHER